MHPPTCLDGVELTGGPRADVFPNGTLIIAAVTASDAGTSSKTSFCLRFVYRYGIAAAHLLILRISFTFSSLTKRFLPFQICIMEKSDIFFFCCFKGI